jgi:response regulator RpfG family c-di-GMP phosphodiesterase
MTDTTPPTPTDAVPANKPTVLCVDDEPNILSALRRLFRGAGLEVRIANSGAEGLALLQETPVDLVISDMRMPEMDGAEFLQHVRKQWPDTVRLLLTGYSEVNSIIDAINRGEIYRYISKPWDDNDILLIVKQALERKALEQEKKRLEDLTAAQNEQLRTLNASLESKVSERTEELSLANEKLKASFVTSIKVFSTLMEMRGGNLSGHSRRVADLCRRLAAKLKLDITQSKEIFIAALLHEIGKVGFSDEMLTTPVASMTPVQQDTYRQHIVQAEHLLMPLSDLKGAIDIIGAQFERYDGAGFPAKLAAQAIPIGARILAVASDYDSMQIGTLAKRQLSAEEASILIGHGSGKRYDPDVIAAFLELLNPASQLQASTASMTEREVSSKQLEVGMVLTRDLITPNGLLMLSADHVMEYRVIAKISVQITAFIRAT